MAYDGWCGACGKEITGSVLESAAAAPASARRPLALAWVIGAGLLAGGGLIYLALVALTHTCLWPY
jgi:hypothetical protein